MTLTYDFVDLPFTGIEVSQAAFTFIYRFMSNKSEENPEGILNKEVLKSFMAIYGDDEENLHWKRGYERFPDNFYKRNPTDEYSIPYCKSSAPKVEDVRNSILTSTQSRPTSSTSPRPSPRS